MLVIENGIVYSITTSLGESEIKDYVGAVEKISIETNEDNSLTYQWTKFNSEQGEWLIDSTITQNIRINDVEYTPIDGKVTITRIPEEVIKTPTLEEQLQSLKQDNLILMDALATVFEEIIVLRGEVI